MARLDVYPMPGDRPGFVVDVQADLLDQLKTRVVVPLIPERDAPKPISDLNPVFEIVGEAHIMLTQALASIPAAELKRPTVSLLSRHDDIVRALDLLFIGL